MRQQDWWGDEGSLLKRAVFVSLALLVSGPVAAGEMESPVITLIDVNWDAAAASLTDHGTQPPAEAFGRLNAITGKRFAGIDKSTVPVLLPFDVDAFRKDVAEGKPRPRRRTNISADFRQTKFFLPGPAGYDATFIAERGRQPIFESRSWSRSPARHLSTTSIRQIAWKKKSPSQKSWTSSFPASAEF